MNGMVRTDNMLGTKYGGALVSVKYAPSGTPTAVDNGNFVVVGGLATGEREVHTATTPAANSAVSSLVLVATPEINKAKKYSNLGNFTNAAGSVARGYKLVSPCVFSLTADAFDTAISPTVGTSILECQASTKGKLVNSPTSDTTKIADLIAIETDGATTWYVFAM